MTLEDVNEPKLVNGIELRFEDSRNVYFLICNEAMREIIDVISFYRTAMPLGALQVASAVKEELG